MSPLISVIVPTYNSADNLRRFLNSFTKSKFQDFEIIVNDDNRTNDVTPLIVQEAQKKGVPVNLIKENRMMAQARKAGAAHAHGKYLLHLDSDMEVTPDLLQECIDKAQKDYDALVIPEQSFGTTFWARCKWLEKKCYDGVDQMESLRFIRKDTYDSLGGHDERMVFSEDKDFDIRVRKANYRIGRTSAHLMHNEGDLQLLKTLRKKAGYSKTANIFAQEHPEHIRWQANIFNRYVIYLKNIHYLLNHPYIYLGMIFMKTAEFFYAAMGMLLHKINVIK